MSVTIGVDIGGSSVTAVAVDQGGEVIGRYASGAHIEGGRQATNSAVAAVGALNVLDCAAVGVGIPGQVDPLTGQVSFAVNLGIGLQPYPLASEIEAELGLPVTVENDVRAAALGSFESIRARGDPPQSLALVSIGTGISAGVVIDGVLVRGAQGMAGEIGHVVVDESGALCRCGQRGCLEAVAAGPAIARAWPKGVNGTAAMALFTAAAAGDPAAEKVAGRIAGHMASALIWLAAFYDPEVVVLAGGVADAGDGLLTAVRDQVKRLGADSQIQTRRLQPDQITLARVDDPPGPRGAAVLAAKGLQQREAPAGKQSKTP